MSEASDRLKVLFLCTGNSCRSQMAEGLCRQLRGDRVAACSAGIERHGLNPLAVRAMAEIGIDIGGHRSKTVAELGDTVFDYVITVCGHADEHCPVVPAGVQKEHWPLPDPAKATGTAARSFFVYG